MTTPTTFGLIVSNRGFFPSWLAAEGRTQAMAKLKELGFCCITVDEQTTKHGCVETLDDARKCAALFSANRDRIDGIVVVLPNFGDEQGVTQAIRMAGLDVPILVQASDDTMSMMDLKHRRDSFCGKLSVCANLHQHGLKFTNTTLHTCAIDSELFTADLKEFGRVCRVLRGVRGARIGAIGQRPDAFHTVRYSEKMLQRAGVTIVTVDLSEIIFAAQAMKYDAPAVQERVAKIREYGTVPAAIPAANIAKSARLSLTIEKWMQDNGCVASAIQCWSSIQQHYGCATCLTMSMMGEAGMPSACEADVTGALTMHLLNLASEDPSAAGYLDWNNNFDGDREKCVVTHCSNYPKSFMGHKPEISNLDILGNSLGHDNCFGGIKGHITAGPMTYAKISTDDNAGRIRMYLGECECTGETVQTPGGIGVLKVPALQRLLNHLCTNGFEHHVAMHRGKSARILNEALGKYLGWDVYFHQG